VCVYVCRSSVSCESSAAQVTTADTIIRLKLVKQQFRQLRIGQWAPAGQICYGREAEGERFD
jgi:hypothetical protein